ncbi:IS66 family insertion sequence element accessory protein TnpB [Bacteroides mediterraneensis]|uniref:IS66 family insertion sequence element accessory protein TnpB n=1 Tax=Bacteroides mediterraneensis TaxID=1841856 RepID=UPI001EF72BD6|nr:IS66 family insertion sequence element accessory protein TnpB [Bacteroides mediterraneensis]
MDKPPDDTLIPLGLHCKGNLPSSEASDVTMDFPSGIRIHFDSHGNPDLTFGLIHKLCAMFCVNNLMRYFLCPGKTDMHKGINSLCGVVHDRMGHDVRLGDVFIFINRSRTTMKLLHAEDGGMVLYVKRSEIEEG